MRSVGGSEQEQAVSGLPHPQTDLEPLILQQRGVGEPILHLTSIRLQFTLQPILLVGEGRWRVRPQEVASDVRFPSA